MKYSIQYIFSPKMLSTSVFQIKIDHDTQQEISPDALAARIIPLFGVHRIC
ncbi:MAG: hypothetical protein Q8Q81_01215 [Oxalobacteraceae bacterium]|nr:hypothetical protein [Oxalobacteraceae bacterium]